MKTGQLVKERYKIIKKIGQGGMADIFLVQDIINHKKCAMKMMKSDDDTKVGRAHERFKAEANVLAKINSINVVEIYDAFLEEDDSITRKFIIMEFIDGQTLKEYMDSKGILANRPAIKLIGQVLNGLFEMEKIGIIHRDLKPQNILVTPDGYIKIIDFGIVKTPESIDLTKTGSVVGSVQYIAPEVIRGFKESPASDIYSSGIILYSMLTGVIPFNIGDIQKIIRAKTEKMPPNVRHYNEEVDNRLEAIVMKSIQTDPIKRYKNAKTMLDDLRNYLENKPLIPTTQSLKRSPTKEEASLKKVETNNLNKKEVSKKPNHINWKIVMVVIGLVLIVTVILILIIIGVVL